MDFDFSSLDELQMTMRVDVGASSLYSEQLQVQTLSNLISSGILDDPAKMAVFLEAMPGKYIPARAKLKRYNEELLKQTLRPQPMNEGFNPAQPVENTMTAQP